MGLWDLAEKLTGFHRMDLKAIIKQRAIAFGQSLVCKCGQPVWMHEKESGKCLKTGCTQFQSVNPDNMTESTDGKAEESTEGKP
jgi:hypothetical protein